MINLKSEMMKRESMRKRKIQLIRDEITFLFNHLNSFLNEDMKFHQVDADSIEQMIIYIKEKLIYFFGDKELSITIENKKTVILFRAYFKDKEFFNVDFNIC